MNNVQRSHQPNFFAAVVDSCNAAIITYDGNGIVTSWNQAAVTLFGYAKADAVGQSLTQLFSSDSPKLWRQRERLWHEPASITTPSTIGLTTDPIETVRRRQDGTAVDIAVSLSLIQDGSGENLGFSEIIQDLTHQPRPQDHDRPLSEPEQRHEDMGAVPMGEAEGRLGGAKGRSLIRDISDRPETGPDLPPPQPTIQYSQPNLRAVLDSAIAGIIRLRFYADTSMQYDYISPHCEENFGYTAEEIVADGELWRSRIHPDDWETTVLPELQRVLSHHATSTHRFEYRFYRKDGHITWILANCFVRWDEAQQCWFVTVVDTDITTHKQTEAALAQSETYNRSILRAMPDLLYVVGVDGSYRHLVQPQETIDAITHPSPIGKSIYELLPTDIADRHMAAMQCTLETGELQRYEQQIRVGQRLQDEEVRLIRSGDDEVLLLIRDIGDRKQLENELKRSESQNRAMLTAIPDLMYRVNQNGIYLSYFADPAVTNLLPTENPVGQHLLDYSSDAIVPFDTFVQLRTAQLETLATALETGTLQVYEQTFDIQGKQIWEDVRVIPCGADEVLFIIRDITERKQAEQKQQQAEQRLRQAQRIAHLGNWIIDHQTDALFWSDEVYRIFGQESDQFQPAYETFLSCVHPDDRDRVHHAYQSHLRDRLPYNLTHRILLPNGQIKYIDEQCETHYDADGNPIQSHGTVQDITDRKQAELALHNLFGATAATTGDNFFPALVSHMGQAFGVAYALVTKKVGNQLESLAFYAHGELRDSFSYLIGETPCSPSLLDGEYLAPEQLQQLFPDAPAVVEMQAESHVSVALRDRSGHIIGHLCIVDTKPMAEVKKKKQILQVFAARAAAELERQQATQQLEQLNQTLETTVEQRTTDLRKSEAHVRGLIEAIPDLLVRVKRDGTCLEIIPSAYTEKKNLFMPIREYVAEVLPTDLQQQQLAVIDQALRTRQLQVYEHKFPKGDRIAHEEVRICAISHDEALLMIRDISDRKQAEIQLLQSKQFLQTVLDTFPLSVFWKDRDSAYLGCNQNFLQSTQFSSPAELIGKTDYDMPWPEAETIAFRADDHHVITTETAKLGIIEPLTPKDGRQRWLETNKLPLKDINGNVIGVLGTYQDITARKQAQEALQELSSRLDLALKSANIGTWAWTIATDALIWDKRQYELYGISPDQNSCVTNDLWMNALHPDDRPSATQLIHQAIAGDIEYDTVFRIVRPDGTIRYIKSNAIIQRDTQGNPQQMIGINYDITQQKEAATQLQQTNAELARATRLKDEFLANMSHELRTPLNAILGMTEAFQESIFGAINEQQIRALQTIEGSSTHLLELINDILDVAKIESGQVVLERTSVAIGPLCRSSLAFVQQQALKKQITLEVKLALNLPNLFIDERRIRQVLINLLNNAVKFTPNGGKITLEVHLQPQPGAPPLPHLQISITDTGIGIAPEDITKLFQPFVQIDSALNRQYAGTGLGLALVKRLVELHDGRLAVSSEVGAGSCFTINLPCTTAQPISPPLIQHVIQHEPQSISDLDLSPTDGEAALILLAEDNDANVFSISNYLTVKGYRLAIARNGKEAIALAQQQHPDLILMDIQMPEIDGIEAIQHIRGYTDLANVPIIALTALAMEGDRDRCLAVGANHYLSKPVKLKQLVNTIEQLLEP